MQKKTFKPILLFTDNSMIIRKTKEAREKAPIFQEIIAAAEQFLSRKLTPDEKKLVLTGKREAAIRLLKAQLNMPNASTDTVLNIHGDNGANLTKVINRYFNTSTYDVDLYDIKENEFVLSKNAIVQIGKLGEYWTKSESGNEAYKLSKILCETYNKAIDKGYLSIHFRKEFSDATDNLTTYANTPKGNEGVKPDYKKISRI